MSTLGKVFTVVILLCTLFYLGVTATLFAHRTNWKAQYEQEKAQREADNKAAKAELENRSAMLTDVVTSRDRYQQESASKQREIDDRGQEVEQLRTSLAAAQGNLNKMTSDIADLKGEIDSYNNTISQLQSSMDSLRSEKADVEQQLDAVRGDLAQQRSANQALQSDLAELSQAHIEALEQLQEFKELVQMLPPEVELADIRRAKPVDGKVIAVSETGTGLVIINVGRNKGVMKNMIFSVYRGDQFLGKVRVMRADKDYSSALEDPQFHRGDIQVGDEVTTRF